MNSLMETVWNGASILGPALGGFVITRAGASTAILLDGLTFWAAALCVGMAEIPVQERHIAEPAPRPTGSLFRSARDGMKTLYTLRPVWWITIGAWALNFAYGVLDIGLPLLTHRQLGRSAWVLGSFWTTYCVSSLVGAALSASIVKKRGRGAMMAMRVIGWGAAFSVLLWVHALWMTYMCLTCAGLLFGGYPPLARTVVQQCVPTRLMGRIMGLRGSLIALGPPLGSWLGGTLGRWLTPSDAIGVTGIAVLILGCWLGSRDDFRRL